MDRFGELTGAPGAAAQLTEDAPGLEQVLSWAFARSPGPRSLSLARLASFWDSGLFWLCVPITSSTSCDQVIFVDQATDLSMFSDAVVVEIDRLG